MVCPSGSVFFVTRWSASYWKVVVPVLSASLVTLPSLSKL